MGKKYYIKKTSLNEKEIYYAINRSESGFMTFAADPVTKLIIDEEDLETTPFNIRLYEVVEKVEFEEIKEEYYIINFHLNRNDYSYLTSNYLFQDKSDRYNSLSLKESLKISEKIRNDYVNPNNIRIIVEKNDCKYDYETGMQFKDINLYLKLEKTRMELLEISANNPTIYRDIAKAIQESIKTLKEQGIGGVNDRNL